MLISVKPKTGVKYSFVQISPFLGQLGQLKLLNAWHDFQSRLHKNNLGATTRVAPIHHAPKIEQKVGYAKI